jgi:hypothetical protein
MPLHSLLLSFLFAAFVSLIFCVLKVAFDSAAAAASGSAFRLHHPTIGASSAVPKSKSLSRGKERRTGLKVSFEGDGELRQGGGLDLGVGYHSRTGTTLESWDGAQENGLLQMRSAGRKLSVVPEE